MLKYALRDSQPPTPKDIPQPSHGRVFVNVVEGIKLAHRSVLKPTIVVLLLFMTVTIKCRASGSSKTFYFLFFDQDCGILL